MPLAIITTTIPSESLPTKFCEDLSKLLSVELSMPEEVVTVHVNAGQLMTRNGTHDPNAYIELYHSKGYGTIDEKRKVSRTVLAYAKQRLNIDTSRIFILFKQPAGDDIGLDDGLWSDSSH
ncbi:macrophage migration inhibitory factor homolog [Lytechinus variegatus]|uniref:macrophage migration inhibitory factor homolog n=1 Tax=Lytechinus variegatus TaxID=7654 RepID=UPI001BB2C5B5|nr:macrophage migration inhibitory factor homolog [Lytechinus variegatus]